MRSQVEPGHLGRVRWTAGLFLLVFLGLAGRLVYIQAFNNEKYSRMAEDKMRRTFQEDPARGEIRDRNNRILAASRPIRNICADPSRIGPYALLVAQRIAPILDWDPADLAARLQPGIAFTNDHGQPVPKQYVRLQRKLLQDEWTRLTNAMQTLVFPVDPETLPKGERAFYDSLRARAIFAEMEQERHYPNGSLAAHIIGFTRVVEINFNQVHVRDLQGVYGVESMFQEQLAGIRGWRRTRVDGRYKEVVAHREQRVQARPGLNVVLTLDLLLQNLVEQELTEAMREFNPYSASALVIQPQTGRVLAMACLPSFDPNDPGRSEIDHLRNRIIADQVEPGSTFKIVVISAALNEGMYHLDSPIDCENGMWYYRNRPLRDTHSYDILKVREVLSKSSNIGSAKIGLAMGGDRFHRYVRSYGFGEVTGLGLPGEVSGTVHPVERWDGLTLSRMPIGQSVAVTHLQMAMAMAAIANGGVLMRPQLVERIESMEGDVYAQFPPQPIRQVVSERAARLTAEALKEAVTLGTGRNAALEHFYVAGKTGTAQISLEGRYLSKGNLHSFMGFLPADRPEVVITVMLDRPTKGGYASTTAVPTFRNIAEKIARQLGLTPDRHEEQSARPSAGVRIARKETR